MNNIQALKEIASKLTLLYVEDDEVLRKSSLKLFRNIFKKVDFAVNGVEALEYYEKNSYDVIITDIEMPGLDGLQMAEKIKEKNEEQVIIAFSAYSDSQKLFQAIEIGLDGYIIKPFDINRFYKVLKKVNNSITNQHLNEYYKENLEKILENKVKETKNLEEDRYKNYEDTILALINMIEIRDSYTSGHSQRVANYSKLIAKDLGFSEEELHTLYQAGILHDIGKIAIPDSILLKPGRLNNQEYDLMKEHALLGYEILEKIPMYKDLSPIIKYHHERYDGTGYPEGLKGEEIPLFSQILAISDTFDAMTTSRIYKPRKDKFEALEELKTLGGSSFSKKLLEIAVESLKQVDIDSSINQHPVSVFEEQRFSFFYKDLLTGLYNIDYLSFIFTKNRYEKEYNSAIAIFLKEFGKYNKKESWEKGDEVLKRFAKYIKAIYDEENLFFRFRGDDFIILSKNVLDEKKIDKEFLIDFDIKVEVKNIKLDNINSFVEFKQKL